jgi:hypothetical protein
MRTVLRKLIESENLDDIFKPFPKDHIERKMDAWAEDHVLSIRVNWQPPDPEWYFDLGDAEEKGGNRYFWKATEVIGEVHITRKFLGEPVDWEDVPLKVKKNIVGYS